MKNLIKLFRLFTIIFLIIACGNGNETNSDKSVYNIGDIGPGGGKIFYKNETGFIVQMADPTQNYTAHYLEAAPGNAVGGSGSDATMRWSTATVSPYATITGLVNINSTDIGYGVTAPTGQQMAAINADIGMGRKNTVLIIQYEDNTSTYIYAAKAASNYSNNGKTDWFLPSIGELYYLYQNRMAVSLPTSGTILSSSQFDTDNAWDIELDDGGRYINEKNYSLNYVRAVRAF